MAAADSTDIYQLKISLKHFKPPIWRRVQMRKDSTFKDLHHVIICCMNWSNTHLHIFQKPQPKRGPYDERNDLKIGNVSKDKNTGMERAFTTIFGVKQLNEKITKLSDYFKAPKDVIEYEYDFGDTWYHEIILEKILPSVAGKEYPVCVSGKRGHPKEDPNEEEFYNDDWEMEVFDPKSVKFRKVEDFEWETYDDE